MLAGVAISSMLGGATTLIQYFANEIQLANLVFWTFGDLGSTDWGELRAMTVMVLILIAYCVSHRWDYNALLSGEETAISLGIHVQRLTLTNMILCCLASTIPSAETCFSRDSPRITAATAMEPRKDHREIPTPPVRFRVIIAKAAPKVAPWETPRVEAEARGL